MPMLAPLTKECLLGELAAIVQDVPGAVDSDFDNAEVCKLGKLKVRSLQSSFRGMWRSKKLATYGKARNGRGGRPFSRTKLFSEASPQQVVKPFSAPASIGVAEPDEFVEPRSLIRSSHTLETASATALQGSRRLSSNAPLPVSVPEPLPRAATSLAAVQAPATPRLGLRPPRSASSTGTPLPGVYGAEKVATDADALALAAAAALASRTGVNNVTGWTKPKIARWGGRTRHSQSTGQTGSPKKVDAHPLEHAKSWPFSEIKEEPVDQVCCKPRRPRITRPRPAGRVAAHLEHTELLRQCEFTTSTTPFRTYGSQWVLMQHRSQQTLLAAEIEHDRGEIPQREELLQHGIERNKK